MEDSFFPHPVEPDAISGTWHQKWECSLYGARTQKMAVFRVLYEFLPLFAAQMLNDRFKERLG